MQASQSNKTIYFEVVLLDAVANIVVAAAEENIVAETVVVAVVDRMIDIEIVVKAVS